MPPRKPSRPDCRGGGPAPELLTLGRDMGTAALMFHQAIADRLGLNTTDHKCLDLLCRFGQPATAGDLAEWTGLTTGAVTSMIDRLERAGFVRREPHPEDRRKVVVRPVPERVAEVGRLFAPIAQGISEACAHFSAAELATIRDYMSRCQEVFRRETRRLRLEMADERRPDAN